MATLLLLQTACLDGFSRLITEVRWDEANDGFVVRRTLVDIEAQLLGCNTVPSCMASLRRAVEDRPQDATVPARSDQLLRRLHQTGAERLQLRLVPRGASLDVVVDYWAPLGSKAADETQVFVERPRRGRGYLVVQAYESMSLSQRHHTRIRSYAGPNGPLSEQWWVLPSARRDAHVEMGIHPKVQPLLAAIPGLSEALLASDLIDGRSAAPATSKPKTTTPVTKPVPAPEPAPAEPTPANEPEPAEPAPATQPQPAQPAPAQPQPAEPAPATQPQPAESEPATQAQPAQPAPATQPTSPKPVPTPNPAPIEPASAPRPTHTPPMPAPEPPPAKPAPAPPPSDQELGLQALVLPRSPRLEGPISATQVDASVQPLLPPISVCYRRRLARDRSLTGNLFLHAVLRPNGEILSTSVFGDVGGDLPLLQCVKDTVEHWSFPALLSADGANASVTLPISFWTAPLPKTRKRHH